MGELIGVVRPNRPITEIREITRTTGSLVLAAGGVVRGITNWGTFLLPKPARKQGATYHPGHYFILRFDSSAKTQHAVRRTLGLDPRMIRYSVVKMGVNWKRARRSRDRCSGLVSGAGRWSKGDEIFCRCGMDSIEELLWLRAVMMEL